MKKHFKKIARSRRIADIGPNQEETPMPNQNPLFIPGPTNIPDRLRHAMNVQTQDHRAPDFVKTFAPVLEKAYLPNAARIADEIRALMDCPLT